MAIYRNVSLSFWEDNKVVDNFTYKDKYFLLYLLTNPHTNLIGCYEVSIRQMSNELELDKSEVEELLTRMEQVHKVILYAEETKEILIKNWHKYNWTKSEKLLKKVESLIQYIKSEKLRKELEKILERYRVSIGYPYPRYTSVSVSVSDSDLNINNNIETIIKHLITLKIIGILLFKLILLIFGFSLAKIEKFNFIFCASPLNCKEIYFDFSTLFDISLDGRDVYSSLPSSVASIVKSYLHG